MLSLHTDVASCVGWLSPEEVVTVGDDRQILTWNNTTNVVNQLGILPDNTYAIDMHCHPSLTGSSKKTGGSSAIFVLACANGKYLLVNKNGKIEKAIEAHQGAVLCTRWSPDGNALVSGGEDGQVKIWSKTGMLRSTLAQTSKAIYSLSWNSDCSSIIYTFGKSLVIKSLQPTSKPLQWIAHDGLVLKVLWNPNTSLILSGAEDCKYKIWDSFGRLLYCSSSQGQPITSLAWTPGGELFAVGSFNMLRLCDKAGWSYCLDKPQVGSLYSLSWCCDGSRLAAVSSSGTVLFAHIIQRKVEWKNFEVELTASHSIVVRDVSLDTWEKLEMQDRVLKMSLSHCHLIVITMTQCFIFSVKNWNTPIVFDLRDREGVHCIIQSKICFLLVEGSSVGVYSYDGKLICSPKWPGMHPELLNEQSISLSNFAVAIRDQNDSKAIHIIDITNGKNLLDGKPIFHDHEVQTVTLDHGSSGTDQLIAFIDCNGDLFVTLVKKLQHTTKRPVKLAVMVQSVTWNEETNMLGVLQEGKLTVWIWPYTAFVDPNLLKYTTTEIESGNSSQNRQIVNFIGNQLNVRRSDGSLVSFITTPYAATLNSYVTANKWDDAIRLCRKLKDTTLWASLAAMALHSKAFSTAEVAYAALGEVDKVEIIRQLSKAKLKEVATAEVALMSGNINEAEAVLIRGGHLFRAIVLNVELNRWDRALEMATKYNSHLDVVLAYRQTYLSNLNCEETKNNFIEMNKKESYDLDNVKSKMTDEFGSEFPIKL
ncbi:Intraflagellar transport protein 80 [Chamberlinius hualienensis]